VEPLSDDRLDALSGPQLLDRTNDLLRSINAMAAELSRTVRTAENKQAFAADGMRSAQSWLRGHGRLSGAAAAQVVGNGRAMEQLPTVAAAHATGDITADQVSVIAKITAPRYRALIEARDGDLTGIAGVLAEQAAILRHDDLRQLVHTFLDRLDADGPEPDPTEERFLSLARHADGSSTGRFHLDAMGTEKLSAALESILQTNRPVGDERSLTQRRADALVQVCDIHLGCGTLPLLRTVRPHVAVRVDLDDLIDPATGMAGADLGFGAVISAARARWAACDADLARYVLGSDGVPLDYGRDQRLVTPELRKAVQLRDGHCVFAGCDAPPWWCEVHHVVHWLFGGETSLENSGMLCERHHTQVHHGFRVERDQTGRWHTYRPDGTEILVVRRPGDDPELARAG
jgi:hypothetical protein